MHHLPTELTNCIKLKGVSTILVISGSGEYLSIADKIYMMDDYVIHDVTAESKVICAKHGVVSKFRHLQIGDLAEHFTLIVFFLSKRMRKRKTRGFQI